MSSITGGTFPGCTPLSVSLCLLPYVFFPWHIILLFFSFKHIYTQAGALNYVWTLWHCDDIFFTSIRSHSLKACPSLCCLGVHILSLDIYEDLMMALSADVSLLLTLNPDFVDTDTDSARGPETQVPYLMLSSSSLKQKFCVLKRPVTTKAIILYI